MVGICHPQHLELFGAEPVKKNTLYLLTSSGGFSAVDVVDDSDTIDGDAEGLELAASNDDDYGNNTKTNNKHFIDMSRY